MSVRIGGCRLRVSFYFFVLLAAAASVPGEGTVIAAGMLAALVHECGHLCAIITICRTPVRCVELTPLGMRMTTAAADRQCRTLPVAALSGAAANLIAAGLLYCVYAASRSENIAILCSANLCLAVINLLPAEPLDGGQFLLYALSARVGSLRAGKITFAASIVSITMLTAAGGMILLRSTYNFSMLFLGLWLLTVVIKDYFC